LWPHKLSLDMNTVARQLLSQFYSEGLAGHVAERPTVRTCLTIRPMQAERHADIYADLTGSSSIARCRAGVRTPTQRCTQRMPGRASAASPMAIIRRHWALQLWGGLGSNDYSDLFLGHSHHSSLHGRRGAGVDFAREASRQANDRARRARPHPLTVQ
jgi:hypothetical protein